MPTKTTGFKSKIFVVLFHIKTSRIPTQIFHHMQAAHCNNLPCEGSIFLHFFLFVIYFVHHRTTWKTRTCYNNNKNNHLYIPAALSFLFFVFFFYFFLPTSTRVAYNQLIVSIFQKPKIYIYVYRAFRIVQQVRCWPSFIYIIQLTYICMEEASGAAVKHTHTHFMCKAVHTGNVCSLYRQFSHNMNAFIYIMDVWHLCTI